MGRNRGRSGGYGKSIAWSHLCHLRRLPLRGEGFAGGHGLHVALGHPQEVFPLVHFHAHAGLRFHLRYHVFGLHLFRIAGLEDLVHPLRELWRRLVLASLLADLFLEILDIAALQQLGHQGVLLALQRGGARPLHGSALLLAVSELAQFFDGQLLIAALSGDVHRRDPAAHLLLDGAQAIHEIGRGVLVLHRVLLGIRPRLLDCLLAHLALDVGYDLLRDGGQATLLEQRHEHRNERGPPKVLRRACHGDPTITAKGRLRRWMWFECGRGRWLGTKKSA
mmetsp:Transcript_21157/g.59200  ORF Transcript_21157/g.59200 Transcript_21157/m.59200 type:complete len:279 (+) Transcript_21157:102-938(+)